MRTTFNLDDNLYSQAVDLTGIHEKSALLHEGLKALIERESARRLAQLGEFELNLKHIPRRQPELAK